MISSLRKSGIYMLAWNGCKFTFFDFSMNPLYLNNQFKDVVNKVTNSTTIFVILTIPSKTIPTPKVKCFSTVYLYVNFMVMPFKIIVIFGTGKIKIYRK